MIMMVLNKHKLKKILVFILIILLIGGGVLFTINGSNITSNTGNYYICNENKEFITSGKYVCE